MANLAIDVTTIPEILMVEHVGQVLGLKTSAARAAVSSGKLGAFVRLGKRLYLRREVFLAALQAREVQPPAPFTAPVPPRPNPDFVELLRRRPRLPAEKAKKTAVAV